MMFPLLLFSIVGYACMYQATSVNQGRLNQQNTFNVHQLIMNYIIGDVKGSVAKSTDSMETRHQVESSGNQIKNRILEQVNALQVNGNRTIRAIETLEREMKSLATHQQTILEAIHNVTPQITDAVAETTFNTSIQQVQSDLELLIMLVRNMSRTVHEYFPKDCHEVFERGGTKTGVYNIKPEGASGPSRVRCEMDGTPWTVLMRRFNGSVDFSRTWDEYKKGFGDPVSEYWIGNELMHHLTTQSAYKARFDMKLWSTGEASYSEFMQFWVGDEANGYKLSIGGESGTAVRGGMAYHNGMKFSTKDRDNEDDSRHCAVRYPGGWWFKGCYHVHFTGPYDNNCDARCSRWYRGKPLKEMSIRVTKI